MIIRNEYLNQLLEWKDKQVIKVVTGIRRCGKSTLLKQYQDRLQSIKDHYEKIILTMDYMTPGNYEGIQVIHLLNWLAEKN